jgi:hypothetical protein
MTGLIFYSFLEALWVRLRVSCEALTTRRVPSRSPKPAQRDAQKDHGETPPQSSMPYSSRIRRTVDAAAVAEVDASTDPRRLGLRVRP